ncbi:hypothetical protein [Staphylococcus phage vB_StaM_SA1]|nr:hypothetical protein [Staphylococcus phage vB_StaM_SA1]
MEIFKLKELEGNQEQTIELTGEDKNLKEIRDAFFKSNSGTYMVNKTINDNIEEFFKHSKEGITVDDVYKLNVIVEEDKQITLIKAENDDQFLKDKFYMVFDMMGPVPVYTDLDNPDSTFDLSGMFKEDGLNFFETIEKVFPTTIELNQ